MYLFVANFGMIDPISRMMFQKLLEKDAYPRIGEQSVHENIIILIFAFSFYLFEIFYH